MKTALLLLVLSIAAQQYSASILKHPFLSGKPIELSNYRTIEAPDGVKVANRAQKATRANLIVGYPVIGDRLLARQALYRAPIANAIQSEDLIYRSANYTTRITSVQAIEVGYTQYASAWIISGGIGWSNVTVRAQSARGYGYNYQIEIWGR